MKLSPAQRPTNNSPQAPRFADDTDMPDIEEFDLAAQKIIEQQKKKEAANG